MLELLTVALTVTWRIVANRAFTTGRSGAKSPVNTPYYTLGTHDAQGGREFNSPMATLKQQVRPLLGS
jgi:hypothetical protein